MKSMIIVGMGPGLSMGIAKRFGREGYTIGMISRNAEKLRSFQEELSAHKIDALFETADATDTASLLNAIRKLKSIMGEVDILQYNAVDYRMKHILDDTVEELSLGFKISVANALAAVQELLPDLSARKGAVLLTGGGSAIYPNPDMGSISIGKAGIRNLSLQLNQALKEKGVFAGSVIITGWIQPDSLTHSPEILAEKFWQMNINRDEAELIY